MICACQLLLASDIRRQRYKVLGFCSAMDSFVQNRNHRCLIFSTALETRGSLITRAARSKRKMVTRMNSRSSSVQKHSYSSSRKPPSSAAFSENKDICSFTSVEGKKLRFILQKELRKSDVGSLGRIILPKRASEAFLPSLKEKEGIKVALRDVSSTKIWYMRYRFWPNHGSKMYLLENAGDYVLQNQLRQGDIVMIFTDDTTPAQLYISCRKVQNQSRPAARKWTRKVAVSVDGSSDKLAIEVGNSSSSMVIAGGEAAVSADGSSDKVAGDVGNCSLSMVFAGSTSNQWTDNADYDGTFASSMKLSMQNAGPSFTSDMVLEERENRVLSPSNDSEIWDLDELVKFHDFDFSIFDVPTTESIDGVNKDNDGSGVDNVVAK